MISVRVCARARQRSASHVWFPLLQTPTSCSRCAIDGALGMLGLDHDFMFRLLCDKQKSRSRLDSSRKRERYIVAVAVVVTATATAIIMPTADSSTGASAQCKSAAIAEMFSVNSPSLDLFSCASVCVREG